MENDGTMASPPAAQTTIPQIVVKAPANLFEFVKAWTSAVNAEKKWQLINVRYRFLSDFSRH